MNNTIYTSDKLIVDIPILIVDFDSENVTREYKLQAKRIIQNILQAQENTGIKIYNTCCSKPIAELKNLEYTDLLSWGDSSMWRTKAKTFLNYEAVQICGMFRELCMVAVADYLIDSGIKPIIITNDDYSISAEASVAEGDTLENRTEEVNRNLKYLNSGRFEL